MSSFPTPKLTRILQDALQDHQPPLVHGRRIKLRYAHQGGKNPPIIIIHGNQTNSIPDSCKRYLANKFRHVLHLHGAPLQLEFKSSENPYRTKPTGSKRVKGTQGAHVMCAENAPSR